MKRKTEFNLNALLDLISQNDHLSCMLINELGIICVSGEDENMAGRDKLLTLLNDSNPNYRAIAFSYLYMIDKNLPALADFRARAENQSLLEMINETLGD